MSGSSSVGFFGELMAAIEHGASSIYHSVVATEPNVSAWSANHPDVGSMISDGLAAATDFASRMGVPGAAIANIAVQDITAAVKGMAAADATVQSGAGPAAPAQAAPATAAPS